MTLSWEGDPLIPEQKSKWRAEVGKEVLKTASKTEINKASLGTVTMMVLFSLQKCSEKGNSKLVREHLRIYIFCSFPGCIIPNSLKAPLSVTNMYRII